MGSLLTVGAHVRRTWALCLAWAGSRQQQRAGSSRQAFPLLTQQPGCITAPKQLFALLTPETNAATLCVCQQALSCAAQPAAWLQQAGSTCTRPGSCRACSSCCSKAQGCSIAAPELPTGLAEGGSSASLLAAAFPGPPVGTVLAGEWLLVVSSGAEPSMPSRAPRPQPSPSTTS